MEEKIKRECKPYVEKIFKKHDEKGCGAVTIPNMRKIIKDVVPDLDEAQEEELNEMLKEMAGRAKYSVLNKQTKKIEVHYQENSIDFPAALYMCVFFLKKFEIRNNDCFSGKSTVNFNDLSGATLNPVECRPDTKKGADRRKFF